VGVVGVGPTLKNIRPPLQRQKKELGGQISPPPWHDSVVIHETDTTTVTFNMQNMTRIVNNLHNSGHVLSTRRDSHRFYRATMRNIYARYCCRRLSVCLSNACIVSCDKTKAPSEKKFNYD